VELQEDLIAMAECMKKLGDERKRIMVRILRASAPMSTMMASVDGDDSGPSLLG
jgi:hypothetical protein